MKFCLSQVELSRNYKFLGLTVACKILCIEFGTNLDSTFGKLRFAFYFQQGVSQVQTEGDCYGGLRRKKQCV